MKMDKIAKLGTFVLKTRKDQGLTQVQLAATTGVGVRFIRELEKGKESCHIGKVVMVLTMLGIDIQLNGEKL